MYLDLPLHGGHCPNRLFEKIVKLSEKFLILFIKEKGTNELLNKLSHPIWFQSLGCYLGFDWHSSGLTTVIGGALTQALKNINYEIGIFVAGGKGKTALKTPQTIEKLAYKFQIPSYNKIKSRSRLLAKIDNNLIQDGFNLYYHTIFFDNKGNYVIIQQGANPKYKIARRYHRHSKIGEKVIKLLEGKVSGLNQEEFFIASHQKLPQVLNLLSKKSDKIRQNIIEIIKYIQTHYKMPDHHSIKTSDFDYKKLIKILYIIKEEFQTFKNLINIKGIGLKAIFNLVQTAELIYGDKADRSDPARFSFTHGGKDGTPYEPNPKEFDESIENLKYFIEKAKKQINLKKIFFSIKCKGKSFQQNSKRNLFY